MARRTRSFTTSGIDPRLPVTRKTPAIQFPLFLFLLAIVSLCGAYRFLFVECPLAVFEKGQGDGFMSSLFIGLEKVVVTVGSQPLLAFGVFVALLVPGVTNLQRSRPYFLSVILGSLLVGVFTFVFVKNPGDQFGGAVRSFLDATSQRELPPRSLNQQG